MRQKFEEKRQLRVAAAAGPVVTPTPAAAAPLTTEDTNGVVGENREKVPVPGRKKWGDPAAIPTLARRNSITVVVTEGEYRNVRIVVRF